MNKPLIIFGVITLSVLGAYSIRGMGGGTGEPDINIVDLSATADAAQIGLVRWVRQGDGDETTRYLLDPGARAISRVTLVNPKDSLTYLNIERGLDQAVGIIRDGNGTNYRIVRVNLPQQTYRTLFQSPAPLLTAQPCGDDTVIFVQGRGRTDGVNRVVSRDVYRLATGLGGDPQPERLTALDAYQADIVAAWTNGACRDVYYVYYDGKTADNPEGLDRLARTGPGTGQGKGEDLPTVVNGKEVAFRGDFDPATGRRLVRDGFYAKGSLRIVSASDTLLNEPYDFPSEAIITPDGRYGLQVRGAAEPGTLAVHKYRMDDGAKQIISPVGYRQIDLTLRPAQ